MPGLAAARCVVYVIFAELLVGREDLDGAEQILRAQADAGDGVVASLIAEVIKQGRGEEAERLRRFGLNPDGSTASAWGGRRPQIPDTTRGQPDWLVVYPP